MLSYRSFDHTTQWQVASGRSYACLTIKTKQQHIGFCFGFSVLSDVSHLYDAWEPYGHSSVTYISLHTQVFCDVGETPIGDLRYILLAKLGH